MHFGIHNFFQRSKCALVLTTVLLMSSCASTVVPLRFYSSPPKPGSQVARLINRNGWGEPIEITAIDGKPVIAKTSAEKWVLEVLPGSHTVTVRSNTNAQSTVPWKAEAGQMYHPVLRSNNPRAPLGGMQTISGQLSIEPDPTHYLFKIVE